MCMHSAYACVCVSRKTVWFVFQSVDFAAEFYFRSFFFHYAHQMRLCKINKNDYAYFTQGNYYRIEFADRIILIFMQHSTNHTVETNMKMNKFERSLLLGRFSSFFFFFVYLFVCWEKWFFNWCCYFFHFLSSRNWPLPSPMPPSGYIRMGLCWISLPPCNKHWSRS